MRVKKTSSSSHPSTENEVLAGYPAVRVAGVDEVGRGCIAGPVVAAALILPSEIDLARDPWIEEIRDSKLLSADARERLMPQIERWALAWAVAEASLEEIARLNIYHATHLAMKRAVEKLAQFAGGSVGDGARAAEYVLVDGNVAPKGLDCPARAIVKGDQKCLSIAAASILAKVSRDRQMLEFDRIYPGYGFAEHKGYGTPAHLAALRSLGATPIHRCDFAPVAEVIAKGLIGAPGASPASSSGNAEPFSSPAIKSFE